MSAGIYGGGGEATTPIYSGGNTCTVVFFSGVNNERYCLAFVSGKALRENLTVPSRRAGDIRHVIPFEDAISANVRLLTSNFSMK